MNIDESISNVDVTPPASPDIVDKLEEMDKIG
jgi:hypothetical protein